MNSTKQSRVEELDQTNNAFNAYDLAGIEEMDPSLADGFKVSFDREIPVELR